MAETHSFDIVCKVEMHEVHNAVDQAKKKLAKRNIPLKALNFGKAESALGGSIRQVITFQSGIPMEKAKELVKFIKGLKLKVQSQIQEDKVRVTGQKIDDLQAVMKVVKDQDYDFAIQFVNYK